MINFDNRSSLKKELLSSNDWYMPFEFDENTVQLKKDWMKSFHNYRKKHIFSNLVEYTSLENSNLLDIGCNEGYYTFAALEFGAKFVKGLDLREINILRANKIKQYYGYEKCEFELGDVSDEKILNYGLFDIVFCFGILYHLENPMLAIRNLRKLTKKYLVVDSVVTSFDKSATISIRTEDKNNLRAGKTGACFYPSLGGLLKMLEVGGFKVDVLPPTVPEFWSFDCGHDYRKNQVTLICQ
jgi:2-polyprenyl-3-methyl-5-hydroxy-6-metoxy-1,4-benzoquinol methylase